MDVKIGVLHTPRELVIDSLESQADIEKNVSAALDGDSTVLSLVDRRGKKVLVPVASIAYVEIDESDNRRVGFAPGD